MAREKLLEREGELRVLEAAVDGLVRRGEGGVVVVEGLPGIGKSRLLDAAGRIARERGAVVLSARGAELEFELAFGGVRQLFTAAVLQRSREEQERVLSGPAGLARSVLGLDGAPLPGPALADGLFGLYWLTANLAELAPLVLAVDDAHWLDDESSRFLAYVAGRVEGLRVLLVAAARPDEPGARATPVAALHAATVVRPRPLSEEAVARLVVAALVRAGGADLAAEFHRLTGGNPFLVGELMRLLGGAPRPALVDGLEALAPTSVARSVLTRVARVSPAAEALARAVALFPAGAPLSDAAATAEVELGAAAAAADALVQVGVLAPGPQLAFLHPLMRAAVYDDMGDFGRRHGHARAAAVLLARDAPAEEVAAHLLAGEPGGDPAHARVLEAAAAAATTAGALRAASRYLERAVAEPPAPEERHSLRRQLGRIQARIGAPQAESTLRVALAEAVTDGERADTAIDLAAVLYGRSHSDDAVEALLLARAGGLDRERGLLVDGLLAVAAWDSTRHHHLYVEVADALPADLEGCTPGERLVLAQVGARMFDRCEPHGEVLGVLLRAVGEDPAPILVGGIDLGDPLGLIMACGGLDEAEDIVLRRQAHARAAGWDAHYVASQVTLVRLAWTRGDLRDAEATVRLGLELPGGNPADRSVLSSWLSALLVAQGDLQQADEVLAQDSQVPADSPLAMMCARRRAELDLARGRPAEALAVLERSYDVLARRGSTNPAELLWVSGLADAMSATGRREEAVALLRDLVDRAERFGEPRPLGVLHHTLGRLLRSAEGLAHMEQAVAVLEGSPYRLDLARAQLDFGAALRRANRRTAARAPLSAALDYAQRSGAAPLATQAEEELRATGARPRRLVLTGLDALTPSEARIARLAAQGMTNRQLAEHLFLTVKTVEMHLGRVYRKLGVSSRRELAAAGVTGS